MTTKQTSHAETEYASGVCGTERDKRNDVERDQNMRYRDCRNIGERAKEPLCQ